MPTPAAGFVCIEIGRRAVQEMDGTPSAEVHNPLGMKVLHFPARSLPVVSRFKSKQDEEALDNRMVAVRPPSADVGTKHIRQLHTLCLEA